MVKVNIRRFCRWREGKNDFHRHAFEGLYPALKGVAVRGRRKMLGLYCISLRDTDIKSQYKLPFLCVNPVLQLFEKEGIGTLS